jgi:hypothetical protein
MFKVEDTPFICLINKYGDISYVGHPSLVKLEQKINELVVK